MRIRHPNINGELEFDVLKEFIRKGKLNGWASGAKAVKQENVKKYSHFDAKNQLFYVDSFTGDQGFIGEEIVTWHDVPIWGMNYTDVFRVPSNYTPERADRFKSEVFGFLKEMLLAVPINAPFRGPFDRGPVHNQTKSGNEGIMDYYNEFVSPHSQEEHVFRAFSGIEKIRISHHANQTFYPFCKK